MAPKKSALAGGEIQCPLLKLNIDKGPLSGHSSVYTPGSVIRIGRVVRGNTLAIKDAGISSKHIVIQVESGSNQWSITDLRSSNGTILNGEQLEPSEPIVLSDGDVIKIGELTSMSLTFEVDGSERNVSGENVRRNLRRGTRKQGIKLGDIDEDSELGLGGDIGNNLDAGGRNDNKGVKLGRVDEVKARGRKNLGSDAIDLENEGEEVEEKLRKTRNSKKQGNSKFSVTKLDGEEEKSENVGGVEVKGVTNVVSMRRTRGSKKNDDLNRIAAEDLGVRRTRSSRKEEYFLDLSIIESRRRRKKVASEETHLPTGVPLEGENTEKLNVEQEIIEEEKIQSVVDNESVEEGLNIGKEGAAGLTNTSGVKEGVVDIEEENTENLNVEQENLEEEKRPSVVDNESVEEGLKNIGRYGAAGLTSTSGVKEGGVELEEENTEKLNAGQENLKEEKIPSVVDNESVEEVLNIGREGVAGLASTSGVKKGVVEMKGKKLKDLEMMTLGEWFDFLEVHLPKEIIGTTEEMISEMKQKARRLHEYKLQQKNAKKKGKQ